MFGFMTLGATVFLPDEKLASIGTSPCGLIDATLAGGLVGCSALGLWRLRPYNPRLYK